MEISNNYSTAKVWNTSNKNVSKSSKKNKWKLTDSLKEKIVDLAKKDAQDNVYMGNAFMNLRKTEVSKVAPNRAALIGKFSQSMNSGNMSAMKEVEEADKKWLCMLFGIPYEAKYQGTGTGSAIHVYNEEGEEVLTYTGGVGWQEKETKAESQVRFFPVLRIRHRWRPGVRISIRLPGQDGNAALCWDRVRASVHREQ